jgi:hypothetical protein
LQGRTPELTNFLVTQVDIATGLVEGYAVIIVADFQEVEARKVVQLLIVR